MEFRKVIHEVTNVVVLTIWTVAHVDKVDLHPIQEILIYDRSKRWSGCLRVAQLAGRAVLTIFHDETSSNTGVGRKEGTYLFDQTTIVNTIHIYENAMVRRLSLRLNIAASATATEIIIIII